METKLKEIKPAEDHCWMWHRRGRKKLAVKDLFFSVKVVLQQQLSCHPSSPGRETGASSTFIEDKLDQQDQHDSFKVIVVVVVVALSSEVIPRK